MNDEPTVFKYSEVSFNRNYQFSPLDASFASLGIKLQVVYARRARPGKDVSILIV